MADVATISGIGPEHHGRRMSLDDFSGIAGRPGFLYELEKGVIAVVDVPGVPHWSVIETLRALLYAYRAANPGVFLLLGGGSEVALRMRGMESERHPDLSIYLSRPPRDDPQPWEYFTPDIVIEVVSKGSEERDYIVKRDEYLKAGIREYWIVDPQVRSVVALTRRNDTWRERALGIDGILTTALLPGLEVRVTDLFRDAAG